MTIRVSPPSDDLPADRRRAGLGGLRASFSLSVATSMQADAALRRRPETSCDSRRSPSTTATAFSVAPGRQLVELRRAPPRRSSTVWGLPSTNSSTG